MTFERKKIERTVIVEDMENDKEFVRRIISDLVIEEGQDGTFSKCPNFTKAEGCAKCRMKTKYTMSPPDDSNDEDNTDCALIAFGRLVKFIHKNMRRD
jgi:hypothetical protein